MLVEAPCGAMELPNTGSRKGKGTVSRKRSDEQLRQEYVRYLAEIGVEQAIYNQVTGGMRYSASRLHSTQDTSCTRDTSDVDRSVSTVGRYSVAVTTYETVGSIRKLSRSDLEDVAHDTWETLLTDVERYTTWADEHTQGDLVPLLRKIARDKGKDELRILKRRYHKSLEDSDVQSIPTFDTYLHNELFQVLASHKRLTAIARGLLAGMQVQEIAKQLKVTRMTISRDVNKLKTLLTDYMKPPQEQDEAPIRESRKYAFPAPMQVENKKLSAWYRARMAKRELAVLQYGCKKSHPPIWKNRGKQQLATQKTLVYDAPRKSQPGYQIPPPPPARVRKISEFDNVRRPIT